ncbi:MAG: cell division protein FtsQ/DivIB [Burkholderiales bacterium]|jgi:cell division protein FtsQ|nr:cell division protein FtsQ/DivIB [Burkholderiales bacterium]
MWNDPKALNAVALTLVILSAGALLWAAGHWLVLQPSFAFRQVVVRDLNRADPAHVAAVIRRELKGTFFTMDLDGAQQALRQVPWVRNAGLHREWPDRLEVSIEEFEPFANWNDSALVTRDGVVFVAPYDGDLPELAGRDDEAVTVIERFEKWSVKLAALGLDLRVVQHSPRGSWRIEAVDKKADKNGSVQVIELGRDIADARLERFASVYQKTAGALARAGRYPEYIDLRYQNGLAIRATTPMNIRENETQSDRPRPAGSRSGEKNGERR